jgi:hypothetical protein
MMGRARRVNMPGRVMHVIVAVAIDGERVGDVLAEQGGEARIL